MQFFKHDSDMLNDPKIQQLMMKHGGLGYGTYNAVLERIVAEITENNQSCSLPNAVAIITHALWERNIEAITQILEDATWFVGR